MTWKRSDVSRCSSWTKAQIRRARRMPLKPVLDSLGYRLQPRPNGNYRLLGVTAEVVVKDHYWICLDNGKAGNAIDFLVNQRGMSFSEAVERLLQREEES